MSRHSAILRSDRLLIERAVYDPGLYMEPHTDKISRISIILDGAITETAESENIAATSGSLLIKPKKVVHENVFGKNPVTILSIGFEDEKLFSSYFTTWQFITHPKVYVQAIRLWTELARIKNGEEIPLNSFSSVVLHKYDIHGKAFFWAEQLKELLAQDLSEPENIYALSKRLSLHRVYMTRAFKKKYGISPVEYRKYAKIAAAFLDLSLTRKTLVAIAFDNGFSDQSHMNRKFRIHAGCTPVEFREITCC